MIKIESWFLTLLYYMLVFGLAATTRIPNEKSTPEHPWFCEVISYIQSRMDCTCCTTCQHTRISLKEIYYEKQVKNSSKKMRGIIADQISENRGTLCPPGLANVAINEVLSARYNEISKLTTKDEVLRAISSSTKCPSVFRSVARSDSNCCNSCKTNCGSVDDGSREERRNRYPGRGLTSKEVGALGSYEILLVWLPLLYVVTMFLAFTMVYMKFVSNIEKQQKMCCPGKENRDCKQNDVPGGKEILDTPHVKEDQNKNCCAGNESNSVVEEEEVESEGNVECELTATVDGEEIISLEDVAQYLGKILIVEPFKVVPRCRSSTTCFGRKMETTADDIMSAKKYLNLAESFRGRNLDGDQIKPTPQGQHNRVDESGGVQSTNKQKKNGKRSKAVQALLFWKKKMAKTGRKGKWLTEKLIILAENFTGKNLDRDTLRNKSFKDTCVVVASQISEDRWIRFLRTKLGLTRDEVDALEDCGKFEKRQASFVSTKHRRQLGTVAIEFERQHGNHDQVAEFGKDQIVGVPGNPWSVNPVSKCLFKVHEP